MIYCARRNDVMIQHNGIIRQAYSLCAESIGNVMCVEQSIPRGICITDISKHFYLTGGIVFRC